MSFTTQRVLLTMLLYELLRRQRRRRIDNDDDDDDENDDDEGDEVDEDNWTDESDSEEEEESSSYEDDYDDDDDGEDDDQPSYQFRQPKLDPSQLQQLPKVEKRSFCQKWIIGQKNMDYLLKEEPMRSPSARLARTPPPPTALPLGSSTTQRPQTSSATPDLLPNSIRAVQESMPNKRKFDATNQRTTAAAVAYATRPIVTPTTMVVRPTLTVRSSGAATYIRPTVQTVPAGLYRTPGTHIIQTNSMLSNVNVLSSTALQKFNHGASNITVMSPSSPITMVRVPKTGSLPDSAYPKLVTTLGPTGLPVRTLLVRKELPAGSKCVVSGGNLVPRLVYNSGELVKLVDLQEQQRQLRLKEQQEQQLLSVAVNVSKDDSRSGNDVPSKKSKMEADKPGLSIQMSVKKTTTSPLRNSKRVNVKVAPETSTLRRSARLVNSRKVYC